MKNTKELHSILGVLYFLNRLGNNDKDIENVLNYAFDRIFGQNTYNLMIACIGHTKETAMDEIMKILKEDTKYHEFIERRKKMKPYKTMAHINSLNGEMKEITVLDKIGDNKYKVDYNGTICSAIFNWYVCSYYADDIYGKLEA